ncbi:MAG: hypothetical protein GC183_10285 [Thiobacillus sp.]|nr:hypothetical protein [Thiobacillus sp.]
MRYGSDSSGSVWLPKLLGTYEIEIEPFIQDLLAKPFDTIVVAGAAEGYYAVGFALRTSCPVVYAFEPNPEARRLLGELASMNGVAEKIRLEGVCDLSTLNQVLEGRSHTLVFVDIEGGEALLLDPLMVPALKKATIVVEVHEMAVPGVGRLLRERFENTHDIIEQRTKPRRIEDYPMSRGGSLRRKLTDGAAIQLLSERRGCEMSWLIMSFKC